MILFLLYTASLFSGASSVSQASVMSYLAVSGGSVTTIFVVSKFYSVFVLVGFC